MTEDLEKRARGACCVPHRAPHNHPRRSQTLSVSKSTVHKDLSERLERIDRTLYAQVKEILEQNKAERHIRGGDATRRKYQKTGTNPICPRGLFVRGGQILWCSKNL